MSGVHRFLSRRDKNKPQSLVKKTTNRPDHFNGIFTPDEPTTKKKTDKEEERKVKGILARLQSYGIENIDDANVEYALRTVSPTSDPEAAFKLLMLLEETYEGIVRPYDPNKKLLGAINRESVTCYLDALLFAMFARLDSFEAMLYDSFEDPGRRRLAGILRLWVNLLRTGRLIPVDVTKQLQEALAACGWEDGAKLKQQDPSEAFGFITGKLELPLLTLKMDLYHTGQADTDDHKFINERLLEVAITEQPGDGNSIVTLEDCLEQYFNNRIEVKRHLENQRRNTLKQSDSDEKKEAGLHVEIADLGLQADSPLVQTPLETPTSAKSPLDRIRPGLARGRADSIFSQRRVEILGVDPEKSTTQDETESKTRKMSTRTEVLMPAWQFFKLLPWYTDHMPTSDAQVAAHFSKKRPVLGICLKRYSFTNDGKARRLETYIDIPLEIAVPNFVSDDNMEDTGPLVGNFRLLLQSVVCHRGVSVHSGHYICLSRGKAANAGTPLSSRHDSDSDSEVEDPWMRFDDMAKDRITYVDIQQALKDETPYLLFYQVQPIGDDGHSIHDLPSYAEATSRSHSVPILSEKSDPDADNNELSLTETASAPVGAHTEATETADWASPRTSTEGASPIDAPRGRSSTSIFRDERRRSIAFDESSFAGSLSTGSVPTEATSNSVPDTPAEEKNGSFLSVIGSRKSSRPSKSRSRTTSTGPDVNAGRFTLNMSKLTAKMSRTEQPATETTGDVTALPNIAASEKAPSVVAAVAIPDNDSKETVVTNVKPLTKETKREKDRLLKQGRRAGRKAAQDDRECLIM